MNKMNDLEKNNDLEMKKIADDELEDVSGGRGFWGVVTTEFRQFFGKDDDRDHPLEDEEEDEHFGVRTLEMRVNPNKKRGSGDSGKIMKL